MVRFLSLPSFLGETVRPTEVQVPGIRFLSRFRRSGVREVEFGPDGLLGYGSQPHAPPVGQGLHQEQSAPGVAPVAGRLNPRQLFAPGVRHLDTQDALPHPEREPEAPAGDPAVRGGVRGEFGDDLDGRLRHAVRDLVIPHPLDGEQAGEPGPTRCGRQEDAEVAYGLMDLDGVLLIHITERGRPRLP